MHLYVFTDFIVNCYTEVHGWPNYWQCFMATIATYNTF